MAITLVQMGEDATPPARRKVQKSTNPDNVPPAEPPSDPRPRAKALGDTALRFEPPPQDSPDPEAPPTPPRPRTPAPVTPFAPPQPTVASTPFHAAQRPAQATRGAEPQPVRGASSGGPVPEKRATPPAGAARGVGPEAVPVASSGEPVPEKQVAPPGHSAAGPSAPPSPAAMAAPAKKVAPAKAAAKSPAKKAAPGKRAAAAGGDEAAGVPAKKVSAKNVSVKKAPKNAAAPAAPTSGEGVPVESAAEQVPATQAGAKSPAKKTPAKKAPGEKVAGEGAAGEKVTAKKATAAKKATKKAVEESDAPARAKAAVRKVTAKKAAVKNATKAAAATAPEPRPIIEPAQSVGAEPARPVGEEPDRLAPDPVADQLAAVAPVEPAEVEPVAVESVVLAADELPAVEPVEPVVVEPVEPVAVQSPFVATEGDEAIPGRVAPAAVNESPDVEMIGVEPKPVSLSVPRREGTDPRVGAVTERTSLNPAAINPAFLPEILALAAVERLGAAALRRVEWYRVNYPDADGDAVSRAITREFVRRSRRQGFAAGLAGPAGLLVGTAGLGWLQAKLVLQLAAAYGHNPEDRHRAAELLVLQQVHATLETAEAAVRAAERDGSGHRAGRRTRASRMSAPLARAVGAGIVRAVAGRLVRRVVPGGAAIVGSITAGRSTERLAARAVRYYRRHRT